MSTPKMTTTTAGTAALGGPGRRTAHRGGAHRRPVARGDSGLSFTRLVRLELRKTLDTRTSRGLVIAILLVAVAHLGRAMWFLREDGASVDALLLATTIPQGLLLPVLGILTVCSEWSQRTALVTFTQEPRRIRVLAAKTIAAIVLGLVVLVVIVALTLLAHLASMVLAGGGDIDITLTLPQAVTLAVSYLLGAVQGIAFGALFLSAPVAIVAFFMLPVVVSILTTTVDVLGRHAPWFDLTVATEPLTGEVWLTGQQWAHLGTNSLLWVALPLAVGCWRIARKEVS